MPHADPIKRKQYLKEYDARRAAAKLIRDRERRNTNPETKRKCKEKSRRYYLKHKEAVLARLKENLRKKLLVDPDYYNRWKRGRYAIRKGIST